MLNALWRKTITLSKKSNLNVFELFTYKNAKMHGKYPILENERTLKETCIISVFDLRYQNDKTHEEHFIRRYRITSKANKLKTYIL